MFGSRNEKAKEAIRQKWEEGDMLGVLTAGFENFIAMLCDRPTDFGNFMDSTGAFFDSFILETSRQEQLDFAGGKLKMELSSSETINLTADFYFRNQAQQWILKQKTGEIETERFKDWETSVDLKLLRERRTLEFPIDPPVQKG